MQDVYNEYTFSKMNDPKRKFVDRKLPRIDVLKNGYYVIHKPPHVHKQHIVTQSAWDDTNVIENTNKTSGWTGTRVNTKTSITVNDDHVAFTTWFPGNYGHTMHDFLPYLSWLKHAFPSKKFILLDNPLYKNLIKFIDPDFYNNVVWIGYDCVINVQGNLIVTTPDCHPCIMQHSLIDHYVQWTKNLPPSVDTRNVVFYDRQDIGTHHGRVLRSDCSKKVKQLIRDMMEQQNIQGELVMFSGTHPDGTRVALHEQFETFRNAHTIIGPHGTGLVNIMWADFTKSVKMVEFIPGPEGHSAHVQAPFNDYWHVLSGLPVEWHSVIYKPESTVNTTLVDLDHVRSALKAIW